MAFRFQPRANAIAKACVIGVPLLILGAWALMFAYARSDFWTRTNVPIGQPVQFSHQHHVGGLGIDCRYCHTSVESSSFAGIPPTETCMTCHSQVWKEAPVLKPVRDSWQTGLPIKWNRVHDLPDHVYFDHSIHVNKGVACKNCHGQVDRMPLIWKVKPLYMRWCLDCHRQPQNYLRPPRDVFKMKFQAPPDQVAFGRELILRNRVRTGGLTDCYTCHR